MNKKLFVTIFLGCMAAGQLSAQKAMAWNTPELNQQNREQRRANFFAYENETLAQKGDKAASKRYLSMEIQFRKKLLRPTSRLLQTTIRRLQMGGLPSAGIV